MIYLILISTAIVALGGACALAVSPLRRFSSILAIAGVWLGCAIATVPVIAVLLGAESSSLRAVWHIPGGSWYVALDGLSAFFCLPLLVLAPLAALYGYAYFAHESNPQGLTWFFYALLVVSMVFVVLARNGMLFLVAWETMALSSLFLVLHDHEHAAVREAGWIYFVATHIGTAALLAFFALAGSQAGSLDFDRIALTTMPAGIASALFILAVIGFGAKAGFMPFHVWLPEAHPAAPSPVSALMSGVMITMGVYGVLRVLCLLGTPLAAWGWALVVIGAVSGIFGIMFALAQQDIKRLLAYSSVENMGIVAMGIGAGILGVSWQAPALAVAGFAGGLLHLANNTLFKGLLFLGAGAVAHATGTRDMNRLGGLMKRMPWTGSTFLAGSAAIAGLPPFNGFIGEFLLYTAGIASAFVGTSEAIMLAVCLLVSLSLIGGMSAACFLSCAGTVMLGEPRSPEAAQAKESRASMRWPLVILAAGCLIAGLAAPWSIRLTFPAVKILMWSAGETATLPFAPIVRMLSWVAGSFGVVILLVAMLVMLRRRLPRAGEVRFEPSWGCGYTRPTPRMQYTASSFAQPLTELFRACLGTQTAETPVTGYFPQNASVSSDTPDRATERIFKPLFVAFERGIAPIRRLQHGGIHLYVLYIVIMLIALLVWKVGFVR